jgi:hypothetical protein
MANSRKSSRTYIRGYTRADGVKVKGHYSHPKGRSSRKVSRKSSRKCSPPKSQYIKSFKRSNGKRVKGHCSRPRGRKHSRVASRKASRKSFIAQSLLSGAAPSRSRQRSPACSTFSGKDACVSSLSRKGMRRCRYNMTTNVCENLPRNLRERATFQVGGGVVGQQQQGYTGYSAKPGKLSAERLQPFQGNAFFL